METRDIDCILTPFTKGGAEGGGIIIRKIGVEFFSLASELFFAIMVLEAKP